VFVDLGRVEAVLPASEQSSLDSYRPGERLKVYILEVKRTTKIPRVLISRSHPGLLRRLFDLEVPEVHEGIVEIMAQAREAGARSKVAVASKQENVDPVGACVGHRGSRVQAVVDELRGEKVDIVRWSDKAEEYVASALSPAKVSRVMVDEETRSATVVAPDNQLSLAIGREGQNVRLAARLTGWRIDIRSEAQLAEEKAAAEAESEEAATPELATAVAVEGPTPVAPSSEADSVVMGEEAEAAAPDSVASEQLEEVGEEVVAEEPQATQQEEAEAGAGAGTDDAVTASVGEAPTEETDEEADVEPPADVDTAATEAVAPEADTAATQEPASGQADEPEKETAGAPAGDAVANGSATEPPGVE
jgi:transcription antitermination factor NusA-like protein